MPFKLLLTLLISFFIYNTSFAETITVGSKRFTENYILGEIFAQFLEDKGYEVKRKFGMGGAMVAYNALRTKAIDLYPDYTGTIAAAILKTTERNFDQLNIILIKDDVEMLPPLGFDNSYCVVMKTEQAKKLGIKTLSDLSRHPYLKGAFSFEFQGRKDGWPSLKRVYNLNNPIRGIEIPLTYEALKNGDVDFVEAYSTEPMIQKYNFSVLKDDRRFFPKYAAIPLIRRDLDLKIKQHLASLAGQISNQQIIELNSLAVSGVNIQTVANDFLIQQNLISIKSQKTFSNGIHWNKLFERTKTHMLLTFIAVFLAILVAVPVASLMAGKPKSSRFILGFTGVLQTIPSIALLTFMIPLFGIGFKPAIVGLFIYSLLPILRNTHTAMTGIDPRLITAAKGIGLYPLEIYFSVKLPLAFPTILAGIRTATILSIGTATLAAFIGAGGLGEPIVSGLALNDSSLVLQGAVPAAILAMIVDSLFGFSEKVFSKNL